MRQLVRIAALVGGLAATVLCVCGGLLYALLPLLGAGASALGGPLSSWAITGSLIALGCGLALPLTLGAVQSLREKPSPALHWPPLWVWAVLFAVTLAVGQLVLTYAPLPRLIFPVFYVFSIGIPVLAVVSLIGRMLARGGLRVTRREFLAQLATGALLGTSVALILEGVALIIIGVLAWLALSRTAGALDLVRGILSEVQATGQLPDLESLQPLLESPWLVGLTLLTMTVVAPAAEEAVKAVGVLLMRYRQPDRRQAFLWGVTGGAGFALVEGLLSATLSLSTPQPWWAAVSARASTVVIHCLAGGLVGLGWQALFSGQRRWRFPLYYLSAVALHGLWNGLIGASVFSQLTASSGGGLPSTSDLVASAASVLSVGLLLGHLVALLIIARRLASSSSPTPEGEPNS